MFKYIVFSGFAICSMLLPTASSDAAFERTAFSTDLQAKYQDPLQAKVRVLIVPGHDNSSAGAAYGGVREVDINRIVANRLYEYFKADSRFEPILSQVDGDYIPELKNYFIDNADEIDQFRNNALKAMHKAIDEGQVDAYQSVAHQTVIGDVARRLYGTNKWANENGIDLLIHVHFNDYGSRRWNEAGKYSGFTVYTPEAQFGNAAASIEIGNEIYGKLKKILPTSDIPTEAEVDGAFQDQDLIALGSNNTLKVPSVLIEYSYIYESVVQNDFFDRVADLMAFQTYEGVKTYFMKGKPVVAKGYPAYDWTRDWGKEGDLSKAKSSFDILFLQMIMMDDGVYPPAGKSRIDCPMTGKFGSCTEAALKAYQMKYDISPATGYLGPKTREFLNLVY